MHRMFPIVALLTAVVAGAVVAVSAHGQEGVAAPPILHQDLVPPEPGAGRALAGNSGPSVFGPTPTEGQNPAAFAAGARILPEPARDERPGQAEPVHGRGGFAVDRNTETRPDYQTGPDSALQYVTVFNPSVLPFKRMSAMDAVAEDYRMFTSDASVREDLTVGGAPSDDRDMFWGSLVIELQPGQDVPIPSVAPDMRILSYETEPRTTLVFSRDGSDNFYVRTEESGTRGTYRLIFMADAYAGYFAPSVPRRYAVRDVARLAPPGLLKPLPPRVQAIAERAHQELKVSPRDRLDIALDKLTYYFRAFEPRDIPASSGDVYWDLFANQAGVCRHRSFAFMITANALGIPTRYVTNEAHAWVEVWVPGESWLRVDLGGAALRMQVDNASDKSLHQPRHEDPFAQPPAYENNYTQLEGDISGLSAAQIAERQQSPPTSSTPTDFAPEAPVADSADSADSAGSEPLVGPGRSLPALPEAATARKTPTQIRITHAEAEVFRGESMSVTGVLSGGGRGVGGQRVKIWMAPAGQGGDGAELMGHTVTGPDGSFHTQIVLPDDMQLKEYELYASTPGDPRFASSVSD